MLPINLYAGKDRCLLCLLTVIVSNKGFPTLKINFPLHPNILVVPIGTPLFVNPKTVKKKDNRQYCIENRE